MQENTRPRTYVIQTASVDELREIVQELIRVANCDICDVRMTYSPAHGGRDDSLRLGDKLTELAQKLKRQVGQGTSSTDIGRLFNLIDSLSMEIYDL